MSTDPNAPLAPEPEPVDPPPSRLPPIVAEWGALPFAVKVVAVFVFVGVLVWAWNAAGGALTRLGDWRFDRIEAARAEGRAEGQAETDAAIKRAEAAETKAAVLEEQAAALKKVAADAALSAREKARAVEEVQHATEDAVVAAGALPPDAARADVRARLRRLGLQ